MGATHFLTKTLPKVTAEMALPVLAITQDRVLQDWLGRGANRRSIQGLVSGDKQAVVRPVTQIRKDHSEPRRVGEFGF